MSKHIRLIFALIAWLAIAILTAHVTHDRACPGFDPSRSAFDPHPRCPK